jgi:hypothetical protein
LTELLRAAERVLWGDEANGESGHSLTDEYTADGF